MTGAEFLTYVRSTFRRTDKDAQIYEATLDTIMDMRLRFNSEDFKYEAYATIADIGDYKMTLPDDFAHLIGEITMEDTAISSQLHDGRCHRDYGIDAGSSFCQQTP